MRKSIRSDLDKS